MESPIRVLITASGSGGHILPATYIAAAIKDEARSRFPGVGEAEIHFVGTGHPLEAKIIGGRGYPRHEISMGKIAGMSLAERIRTICNIPRAAIQVWKLISSLRPDLTIGVGGYASVLPVVISSLRGIPTWIHEAELKPGIANRVLSKFATGISTAFAEAEIRGRRVVHTGHPLRGELRNVKARAVDGVPPLNLLVLGGSQGARAIDAALSELVPFLKERGVSVRHQCRAENMEMVRASYEKGGVPAQVVSFIEDMVEAYSWADLIVSRGGAGSVMEIGAVNRPTIFVPLGTSSGGHQKDNAQTLVKSGKALCVTEGEGFVPRLKASLDTLLTPQIYFEMLARPVEQRSFGAAETIAKQCLLLTRPRLGTG